MPHRERPSSTRVPQAVTVTTARLSHTDDIALRERRYVLTQSSRLVCVILGVALPVPIWVKLLLFVCAVVLPWLGVVAANAGPTVSRKKKTAIEAGLTGTVHEAPERLAIEPGRVVDG